MAVWRRKPDRRVVVHSDQGSQYGSEGDPEGSLFAFRSGGVLRPPATNDTGDSEFSGSPVPFRRDRVLRVPDLNRGPLSRTSPADWP